MSALGGVFNYERQRPAPDIVEALERTLDARGPDGGSTAISGGVVMIYRAFHTNSQSAFAKQPLIYPDGSLLAWNGRLDNGGELRCRLTSKLSSTFSDIEIIAAAYKQWGIDCLGKVTGDYSLSIWDESRKTLYLARDPFGTRPLFYSSARHHVAWSSEIGSLLSLTDAPLDLDDEFVAGFLTTTEDLERTAYKGIHSVLPGTFMAFSRDRQVSHRFWDIDPGLEIRFQRDWDYEDRFRELFRESVACRLRANGTVLAELSGGLDSSSIVCVADELLGTGKVQATSLETVSYLYDGSLTSNESVFIKFVEEQRNKPGHHLVDTHILAPSASDIHSGMPSSLCLFPDTFRKLAETMHKTGARVLLRGEGGDHLLIAQWLFFPVLRDFVAHAHFSDLAHFVAAWNKKAKTPYLEMMWHGIIWSSLPLALRSAWAPELLRAPKWLHPDFARRVRYRERLLARPIKKAFATEAAKEHYRALMDAISAVAPAYYRQQLCIEDSCPYLHRPLVEFLMAIPINQFVRPGENRSLQRRALADVLPHRICQRYGKRGPDEAIARAFMREGANLDKLADNACVCKRGYVALKPFKEALQRARHGLVDQSQPLARLLAFELWLRSHSET